MKRNICESQRSQTPVQTMRALVEIDSDGQLKIFSIAQSDEEDRIRDALRFFAEAKRAA